MYEQVALLVLPSFHLTFVPVDCKARVQHEHISLFLNKVPVTLFDIK